MNLSEMLSKIVNKPRMSSWTKMLFRGSYEERLDKYNMNIGFHIGLSEVYYRLQKGEPIDLEEVKKALNNTLTDILDFENRTAKVERKFNLSDQLRRTE